MLKLKEFSETKVLFEDENGEVFELRCTKLGQKFDLDLIEDILNYVDRTEERGE